jgi:3-deoxy-D-manno-octulosonic acid kinase
MPEPKVIESGVHAVLYDAALRESADASWFDPAHWSNARGVERETSGRGAVLIVPHGDETWVVRHYRRGGFVAHFIEDHYPWLGAERSRSFREWRLLRRLHDAGLPVPNPIAAHVHRKGLLYTADIITTYLPDTRKLSAFIAARDVPRDVWRRIGRMVRAVHEHGVDHPDLTAHNILLDPRGELFLVDFDNARVKPPGAWRRAGVERLQRSLRKVALETGTEYDEAAWAEVEAGYGETSAASGPRRH